MTVIDVGEIARLHCSKEKWIVAQRVDNVSYARLLQSLGRVIDYSCDSGTSRDTLNDRWAYKVKSIVFGFDISVIEAAAVAHRFRVRFRYPYDKGCIVGSLAASVKLVVSDYSLDMMSRDSVKLIVLAPYVDLVKFFRSCPSCENPCCCCRATC